MSPLDTTDIVTDVTLSWKLLWKGKEYGSVVVLPEGIIARPLLEREVALANGARHGDRADAVADLIGHQIAVTLRDLAGIDDDAEIERIFNDPVALAAWRARLPAPKKRWWQR